MLLRVELISNGLHRLREYCLFCSRVFHFFLPVYVGVPMLCWDVVEMRRLVPDMMVYEGSIF